MSKRANLLAEAALQEIFMDSGSNDSGPELDDSDTDPDYVDLLAARASTSNHRSRSKSSSDSDSDSEVLEVRSRKGNRARGVKRARGRRQAGPGG